MKISSPVEICNLALTLIKQQSISSLDAESVQAVLAKINYEHAKTYLLAGYEWNFAIANAELNKLADNGDLEKGDPGYNDNLELVGFKRQFAYPDRFLRLICLTDNKNFPIQQTLGGIPQYALEGLSVYTNVPKCRMKYIQDVDDVNLFSPQFIECLAIDLAIRLSKILTDSTAYRQLLEADFEKAIARAKIDECMQVSIYSAKPTPLAMLQSMSF